MYPLTFRVRVMLPQQRNRCTDCKSAQQCITRSIPCHSLKLHPGPCNSVCMRPRIDRQTRGTTIHFASSRLRPTRNVTRRHSIEHIPQPRHTEINTVSLPANSTYVGLDLTVLRRNWFPYLTFTFFTSVQ